MKFMAIPFLALWLLFAPALKLAVVLSKNRSVHKLNSTRPEIINKLWNIIGAEITDIRYILKIYPMQSKVPYGK